MTYKAIINALSIVGILFAVYGYFCNELWFIVPAFWMLVLSVLVLQIERIK